MNPTTYFLLENKKYLVPNTIPIYYFRKFNQRMSRLVSTDNYFFLLNNFEVTYYYQDTIYPGTANRKDLKIGHRGLDLGHRPRKLQHGYSKETFI